MEISQFSQSPTLKKDSRAKRPLHAKESEKAVLEQGEAVGFGLRLLNGEVALEAFVAEHEFVLVVLGALELVAQRGSSSFSGAWVCE